MEEATRRRQQQQQQQQEEKEEEEEMAAGSSPAPSLSGQSYWLDLWLFVLFDLALFVVIYLLP